MLPPLTTEEKTAIKALQRLAKKWPKSLWLYSAAGSLHVMRRREDGAPAGTTFKARGSDYGGVAPEFIAATIKIANDCGDW